MPPPALPRRTLLATIAAPALPRPGPRELTIAVASAARQQAVRDLFAAPFQAATGIRVLVQTRPEGMPALTTGLTGKNPAWDLVEVNGLDLAAGCKADLFAKLDPAAIGGAAHYQPAALSPCGIGATWQATVLAWDKDKYPGKPDWPTFWDIARAPGKRGLRQGVRGNLEIALMADGVAPAAVYKVLATTEGIDRAFRRLDQLRPYLVWWKTPPDAARLLTSGAVLMTSAPSEAIVAADHDAHRNFAFRWDGNIHQLQSWAVARAGPNRAAALQFLYFIGTPAIEARMAERFGMGGLARGANGGLAAGAAALSSTAPANLAKGVAFDDGFWAGRLVKLRQRFDAWAAH